MKKLLQRTLRRLGICAVSTNHAGVRYLDHPPTGEFESVLLRIFPSLDGLNFLQVGANDGQRFDPINPYIRAHAWRGVLVEPVPGTFSQLQRTYSGIDRVTLVQAAVDTDKGTRLMHYVRPDAPPPVPEWVWGLASFDRERVLEAVRSLGWSDDTVVSAAVPTIEWSELWPLVPGGRCDVLVLDTEGHDIRLLRAAGLARHRPRLLHFEHAHTEETERIAFYRELFALGYELATDRGDTTAWLI